MLKKILTLITVTALILTVFSVCIFAEDVTVSAVYSSKTNTVTISGNANGNVIITVANEQLLPDMMSEENMPAIVKAVTSSGGKYYCEIGLPDSMEGGKYIVYATTADTEVTTYFIYVDTEEANAVIEKINSADTVSELVLLLDEFDMVIGISSDDPVYSNSKNKFAQLLLKKDYSDFNDFMDAYRSIYPLVALKEATEEEIEKILEEYQVSLGIDYNEEIAGDERLTDEIKKNLYELISSEDFTKSYGKDGFSFSARLEELKALSALNEAENWMTVKKIMTEQFADIFEEMFEESSKYKKVDDKDEIFSEMMDDTFGSISDVEDAFDKAVEKIYKKENPSKNNTSGGSSSAGGGGFSGSGTSYTTPAEIELYEEVETVKEVFSDVPASHWANKAVNLLNEKKIVSGYPDGTFLPSKHITRAEFAKLAVSFTNGINKGESISFKDVLESDWFYSYVSDASAFNIISGLGDGTFAPYQNIKREDAALIVYRILDALGKAPTGSKVFSDRSEISGYARSAISALGSADIVAGAGNGNFNPKDFITRAEATQLLYNAFMK